MVASSDNSFYTMGTTCGTFATWILLKISETLAVFTPETDYPSSESVQIEGKQTDKVRWIIRSIFSLRRITRLTRIIQQITRLRRIIRF